MGLVEHAEVLHGALQLDAAVRDRVVGELAAVAGHGGVLPGAVDREFDMELVVVPTDERGAELGPKCRGDGLGQCPAQNRDCESLAGEHGGVGGLLVVGVSGDPAVVEGE